MRPASDADLDAVCGSLHPRERQLVADLFVAYQIRDELQALKHRRLYRRLERGESALAPLLGRWVPLLFGDLRRLRASGRGAVLVARYDARFGRLYAHEYLTVHATIVELETWRPPDRRGIIQPARYLGREASI